MVLYLMAPSPSWSFMCCFVAPFCYLALNNSSMIFRSSVCADPKAGKGGLVSNRQAVIKICQTKVLNFEWK